MERCPEYRYGLLIFVIIETFVNVAAKFCPVEDSRGGEQKYYICPRNEYCCNFGCCINPAFQFYQLWYYWLLIIVVFLVCSGGGWWFKYCRQQTLASRTPRSLSLSSNRFNRNSAYSSAGSPRCSQNPNNTSRHFRCTNPTTNNVYQYNYKPPSYIDPYYQLYGPPPSYESVVRCSNPVQNGTGEVNVCLVLPRVIDGTDEDGSMNDQASASSFNRNALRRSQSEVEISRNGVRINLIESQIQCDELNNTRIATVYQRTSNTLVDSREQSCEEFPEERGDSHIIRNEQPGASYESTSYMSCNSVPRNVFNLMTERSIEDVDRDKEINVNESSCTNYDKENVYPVTASLHDEMRINERENGNNSRENECLQKCKNIRRTFSDTTVGNEGENVNDNYRKSSLDSNMILE